MIALLVVGGAGGYVLWQHYHPAPPKAPVSQIVEGADVSKVLAEASVLAGKQDYAGAVAKLTAFKSLTPHQNDKYQVDVALGNVYLLQRDFNYAYDSYQEAAGIKAMQTSAAAASYGDAARRVDDFATAGTQYQKALDLASKESGAEVVVGRANTMLARVKTRIAQVAAYDSKYVLIWGRAVAVTATGNKDRIAQMAKDAQAYGVKIGQTPENEKKLVDLLTGYAREDDAR